MSVKEIEIAISQLPSADLDKLMDAAAQCSVCLILYPSAVLILNSLGGSYRNRELREICLESPSQEQRGKYEQHHQPNLL
jgi:hypothetical protein